MILRTFKQWLKHRRETVTIQEAIQIINARHPLYLHHIDGRTLVQRCKGLGDFVEVRQSYIHGKFPVLHRVLFIGGHAFAEPYGRRVPKSILPRSPEAMEDSHAGID